MNATNFFELDKFTQGYIVCALWSSTDEEGNGLDQTFDPTDISAGTLKEMADDCKQFQDANREDLDKCGLDLSRQGHDFWLNRNGHGSGFWDEGFDPVFRKLSDASKACGECNLYIGDDDLIHAY